MAKDIVFQNKKTINSHPIKSKGNHSGFFRPLYQKYDLIHAYDESKRKYVHGMITGNVLIQNSWHYSVRPDYNQEKVIWTNDII